VFDPTGHPANPACIRPSDIRRPRDHDEWQCEQAPLMETCRRSRCDSEAALSILFIGETKPRAYFNEVHVQTLISSAIFAKTVALKVLKIYSPAIFARRVGCKVTLGPGRALTDLSDILPDFGGQIADMMGIPRIILECGACSRDGREFTRKQKGNGQ
jgi:hypothetical protein